MSEHWPVPEDLRRQRDQSDEAIGKLMEQIICPHADTSRQRMELDIPHGGIEYCNTCGAHRYYSSTGWNK